MARKGTAVDLSGLSIEELREVTADAAQRTAQLTDKRRRAMVARWETEAAEVGMTPLEALGVDAKRKRAPAKPKYRNPDDSSVTWSGRGKQPIWLRDALESGKSLEDLRIRS